MEIRKLLEEGYKEMLSVAEEMTYLFRSLDQDSLKFIDEGTSLGRKS